MDNSNRQCPVWVDRNTDLDVAVEEQRGYRVYKQDFLEETDYPCHQLYKSVGYR